MLNSNACIGIYIVPFMFEKQFDKVVWHTYFIFAIFLNYSKRLFYDLVNCGLLDIKICLLKFDLLFRVYVLSDLYSSLINQSLKPIICGNLVQKELKSVNHFSYIDVNWCVAYCNNFREIPNTFLQFLWHYRFKKRQ